MAEYNFNLPPITQLSLDQQNALNEVNPIALSGGPGTGKTVVSIYRHLNLHKNKKKSMLITYTTTLAMYLKGSCKNENTALENITTSLSFKKESANNYHEIIIDEAQDLPSSYYEILKNHANKVSYGADDAQILYPKNSCKQSKLRTLFNSNKLCQLGKNYRSTKSILYFAKTAFQDAYITIQTINSCSQNGDKPILLHSNSIKKQNDAIINIIKQFQNNLGENIAILTPLAKSPWSGGERLTAKYYFDLLSNSGINDVSYYDNTLNGIKEIKGIHITPFKSSKGLEFDTVIIPCFDSLFSKFREIDWKDFFVGATRAKNNLFLICNKNIPSFESVTENTEI